MSNGKSVATFMVSAFHDCQFKLFLNTITRQSRDKSEVFHQLALEIILLKHQYKYMV